MRPLGLAAAHIVFAAATAGLLQVEEECQREQKELNDWLASPRYSFQV